MTARRRGQSWVERVGGNRHYLLGLVLPSPPQFHSPRADQPPPPPLAGDRTLGSRHISSPSWESTVSFWEGTTSRPIGSHLGLPVVGYRSQTAHRK
jgi:hypothetical protein